MGKKVLAMLLVVAVCLTVTGCKSGKVRQTEALIGDIGTVTLDSEEAVAAARESYGALSDKDKENVENYAVLTDAEKTLTSLQKVDAAEKAIAAIGEVTADSMPLIDAANAAYNALTSEEKELVTNARQLGDAMLAYMDAIRWRTEYYRDDFGDPTGDGYVTTVLEGTFSNSVNSSEALAVGVFCMPTRTQGEYDFAFRLLEYGEYYPVLYRDDVANLSFKIDGNVYSIECLAQAGSLIYLSAHYAYADDRLEDYNGVDRQTAFDAFYNAMMAGTQEIPCVIQIGEPGDIMWGNAASTYSFTINSVGLAQQVAVLESGG